MKNELYFRTITPLNRGCAEVTDSVDTDKIRMDANLAMINYAHNKDKFDEIEQRTTEHAINAYILALRMRKRVL